MVEIPVRERMLSMSALTALVGTRVFMLKLPQGEKRPAVRLQRISGDAPQHLRGPVGTKTDRIQTDAYVSEADSFDAYASVVDIAEAIHGDGLGDEASGIFGFIGAVGGSPPTHYILNVALADSDGPTTEVDGAVSRLRYRQDYWVTWRDA